MRRSKTRRALNTADIVRNEDKELSLGKSNRTKQRINKKLSGVIARPSTYVDFTPTYIMEKQKNGLESYNRIPGSN